jgi:hypothetical protein
VNVEAGSTPAEIVVPSHIEGWVVVGRSPVSDETSPLLDAIAALHDARLATLTIDLPARSRSAAECVRAAAAMLRRDQADGLPVAYLGAGKAAAAGWEAALSGDLDGVMAWNGKAGAAWSRLRHLSVPSLLVVEESGSTLPWNLFVARAVSWRLGSSQVEAVGGPQDDVALLARWYWDRILSPTPQLEPVRADRGRGRRRVAMLGAAATLAVPCVAAATIQTSGAGAALPDFGKGLTLSSGEIRGDNALAAPGQPRKGAGDKHRLGAGEIRGDNHQPSPFATGSHALVDSSGVKYFINDNITFSTSSSASGAMSEASYTHAVSASTLNGGTIQSTLNDAYDGYQAMCISTTGASGTCETGNANWNIYNKNGPATTECPNGVDRQVDFAPQTVGSLTLSRKVFVPANDSFARWLDIVKNNGATAKTITLATSNNLGSDSNTRITGSSSGDQAAQTSDTWVTTFQNFSGTTSSDPRLGHVIQGTGVVADPVSSINFANGDDNPWWDYVMTLQPGQTVIVMNFGVVKPSKAASMAKSADLASLSDANALACMTPTEQSEIGNFNVTGTIIVTKHLVSNHLDPAKFNLKVDGTTHASNVGDGGTTGPVQVPGGSHTVSETAGTSANLANYTARIACSDGSAGYGTSLSGVHVANGATVTCTITNTRKLFKA